MKILKKSFRVICLVLLIFLASIGVGIAGGVAVPITRRRENNDTLIELVESHEKQTEISAYEYKPQE